MDKIQDKPLFFKIQDKPIVIKGIKHREPTIRRNMTVRRYVVGKKIESDSNIPGIYFK
jgi:hypothetical protein